MPAVAWSNWVSIEAKSYADINRLANLSASNASGYDGVALGLPGVQLPEHQQIDMRRAYYSAVSHTDEQIGRVLESLTATGLRNSTVVCVFADHGWSLGEHGKWEKHTNFELDVHAPWILSVPPAGSASTQTVTTYTPNKVVHLYTEHVDIMPTLLEAAAGVVIPSCDIGSTKNLCTMGRSRVPLLDGAQQPLSVAAVDRLTVSSDNAGPASHYRPSSAVCKRSAAQARSGQPGPPSVLGAPHFPSTTLDTSPHTLSTLERGADLSCSFHPPPFHTHSPSARPVLFCKGLLAPRDHPSRESESSEVLLI